MPAAIPQPGATQRAIRGIPNTQCSRWREILNRIALRRVRLFAFPARIRAMAEKWRHGEPAISAVLAFPPA